MPPAFAVDDPVDSGVARFKLLRDLPLREQARPIGIDDLTHLLICEFRRPIGFAPMLEPRMCAVSNSIKVIRGRGIPPEIVHPIVGPDSIVMARFHAFGTRTDECFQYQAMNPAGIPYTISVQSYIGITALVMSRFQPLTFQPDSPGSHPGLTPYSTIFSDFVVRKIRNWFRDRSPFCNLREVDSPANN